MRMIDYFLYIKPSLLTEAVEQVNIILVENGFYIEANGLSSVHLNDYEIGEDEYYFKVEDIVDPIKDLTQIKYSLAGGFIAYQYDNSDVLVGFDAFESKLYYTDTISLSFQHSIHEHNKITIEKIIKKIHIKLNSIYTIGGEGISEDIDVVKKEFYRAKNKEPRDKGTFSYMIN